MSVSSVLFRSSIAVQGPLVFLYVFSQQVVQMVNGGSYCFQNSFFCIANMAWGKVATAEMESSNGRIYPSYSQLLTKWVNVGCPTLTSKVDFQHSCSYKMFHFDRAVLECFRSETNLVVAGFWRERCLDLCLCILPARTLTVLKPPDWGHHNVAHLVGRSSPSKVWSLTLFYSVES